MKSLLFILILSLSPLAPAKRSAIPNSEKEIAQNAAFFKKPTSCTGTTTSNCDLTTTTSGQTSGACTSNYLGSCSFKCFRGQWTSQSNTCAATGCPANYVLIPALSPYTTSDFCVAKYEMKNVGGVATSTAAGVPWGNIARGATSSTAGSAWKACKDLGAQYDLMSNAQWQSVARNIETVAANWSSGVVGTGSINRGHTDNTPSSPQAADSSDVNACAGTSQTCSNTVWNAERRTHRLSNGGTIWDIGGNVWDLLVDDYSALGVNPAIPGTGWVELSSLSATNKALFSSADGTRNSTQGIGQIYGSSGGVVIRGGAYSDPTLYGIFSTNLSVTTTGAGAHIGFRCSYTLVPPCAGALVGGYCWYISAAGASCTTACSTHGGVNAATNTYAGTAGTDANCISVLSGLGISGGTFYPGACGGTIGCYYSSSAPGSRGRCTEGTVDGSSMAFTQRACACNN